MDKPQGLGFTCRAVCLGRCPATIHGVTVALYRQTAMFREDENTHGLKHHINNRFIIKTIVTRGHLKYQDYTGTMVVAPMAEIHLESDRHMRQGPRVVSYERTIA